METTKINNFISLISSMEKDEVHNFIVKTFEETTPLIVKKDIILGVQVWFFSTEQGTGVYNEYPSMDCNSLADYITDMIDDNDIESITLIK